MANALNKGLDILSKSAVLTAAATLTPYTSMVKGDWLIDLIHMIISTINHMQFYSHVINSTVQNSWVDDFRQRLGLAGQE